ncbi:MAG: START domain-containing protein [Gammaproteobacteria bacterium]|nr:START domain-containing protein [Gammaproteobacteria bacterium]
MQLSTCRETCLLVGMKAIACLLCAALFVTPARASAQEADWQLRKEQGGIRVFTREQQGSNFAAVRAEMILEDVRLSSLVALIDDPSACALLEARCAASYTVERVSATEQFVYRHNDMPFPIKDRDVVMHFVWTQDPVTRVVVLDNRNIDGVLPENPRRIRLPSAISGWRFEPLGDGRVLASSEGHLEPGASLPAWLLNSLLVDAPFNTMEAVAAAVKLPRYREVQLDFIVERD